MDLACQNEIVQKSGAWFSFEGNKIGQGGEAARIFLQENSAARNKIQQMVFKKCNIKLSLSSKGQKPGTQTKTTTPLQ